MKEDIPRWIKGLKEFSIGFMIIITTLTAALSAFDIDDSISRLVDLKFEQAKINMFASDSMIVKRIEFLEKHVHSPTGKNILNNGQK